MVEGEEESKTKEEIDLSTELSTLVSKNVIPKKLAEKLEKKLKEKNIKINQNQFQQLIGKIQDIMKTYATTARPQENIKPESKEKPFTVQKDENMQNIIKTIEQLKEKITDLEKGTTNKPRIVTTDDIKIPEGVIEDAPKWNVEPLIDIPNNPENVIVLMKWLQYLIDKCGRPNLSNILDYYVDIGWITQDAKMGLIDYSQGITDQTKKDETTKKHITDLPSKDHIQSLVYIQKLKGLPIDKHFVDRIEGELARITKKIDNY